MPERPPSPQLHPDRNPDPDAEEQFQAIEQAYHVLSNPDKRRLYDRAGERGVREGDPGASGGPQDVFSALFGIGGGGSAGVSGSARGSTRAKGEPLQGSINASLNQVYNGDSVTFRYPRKRLCMSCNGRGGRQVQSCSKCDGKGMVRTLRQLGPSMFAQSTATCPACGGRGRQVDPNFRCKDCLGEGLVTQPSSVVAHIERGMQSGDTIVLHGMGHESSDRDPGDLVLKVEVSEHPLFKRQRDVLILKKTISLHEALLGYDFAFEHLDGRMLRVKSAPGSVTKMNDSKVIHEEGIPVHGTTHHGNLVIQFAIGMPTRTWLTPARRTGLATLLPAPPETDPAILEAAESPTLVDFDPSDPTFDTSAYRAQRSGGEAYESDEDQPQGAGPACVPM